MSERDDWIVVFSTEILLWIHVLHKLLMGKPRVFSSPLICDPVNSIGCRLLIWSATMFWIRSSVGIKRYVERSSQNARRNYDRLPPSWSSDILASSLFIFASRAGKI